MTQTGRYHGGLVFLGKDEGALDRFGRIVSATLEDYGHAVERQTLMNTHEARIVSSQYLVKLTLETGEVEDTRDTRLDNIAGLNRRGRIATPQARNRLVIDLAPVAPEMDDRDVSELMLVVMLYRMVDIYSSESIEWLDADVSLTVDKFLGAFANVSPKRIKGRQQILFNKGNRFAPVEDTVSGLEMRYDQISASTPHRGETGLIELTDEEALTLAFRSDPHPAEVNAMTPEQRAENDIRRLTSWSMTGCLAFVSAPVAVSMAAINLIKGEDFRLNTQVLSLTSALVVLQSTGAMASVMSYLPM